VQTNVQYIILQEPFLMVILILSCFSA